jgi:hypothetical protein
MCFPIYMSWNMKLVQTKYNVYHCDTHELLINTNKTNADKLEIVVVIIFSYKSTHILCTSEISSKLCNVHVGIRVWYMLYMDILCKHEPILTQSLNDSNNSTVIC